MSITIKDMNGTYAVLDPDLLVQELLSINPEIQGTPMVTLLNLGLQIVNAQVAKEKRDAEGESNEATEKPSSEVFEDTQS